MTFGSNELVKATGLPRGQLQRWCEAGILQPTFTSRKLRGGGRTRQFILQDVMRAKVILETEARGMARMARSVGQLNLDNNGVILFRGRKLRQLSGIKSRQTIKNPEVHILERSQVLTYSEGYYCQVIPLDEITRGITASLRKNPRPHVQNQGA